MGFFMINLGQLRFSMKPKTFELTVLHLAIGEWNGLFFSIAYNEDYGIELHVLFIPIKRMECE